MRPTRTLHRRWLAVAALAAALPGAARADRIERGVVVALEAGEAYFDIGAATGIAAGDPLRIKHPVELRHPVSRAAVRDELPVGSATVTLVADALAMVRLPAELAPAVRVGDVVEVLVDAPDEPAPAAPEPPPMPAVDDDTAAVLEVWRHTSGARLDVRIAAWERYLEAHPESRFAAGVREDLSLLRELRRQAPSPELGEEPAIDGLAHRAARRARSGEPIPVAIASQRSDTLLAAWLHYRRAGDDTYHRTDLRFDGDAYLRAEIPGHAAAAPGVEYFVEVATRDGDAGSAIGRADAPVAIAVEAPPQSSVLGGERGRSRVTLTSTYLDYATFDDRGEEGDHEDVYSLFEADFFYRLRAGMVHGVRVGMGVLNGRGGYRDRPRPEPAGFNYGYTEVELRPSGPPRALLARLVAGLGEDGLGFGLEGRLRLGPEEASNLSFALSSLEDVGFLSEVRMQWAALRDLPLGFAVAVTDQPNNGDLGVRFTADVGVRALSWFQPTVRVSYQGRSIEHSGIGAGLGLVFDW